MPQADQSKRKVMGTRPISIFSVKADEERPELVHPGESALTDKSLFVHLAVEQPLAAAFSRATVPPVFRDIGDEAMIEAGFAGLAGVRGRVGVEISSGNIQSRPLQASEHDPQMRFEVESVMMIACYNAGRSRNEAVRVCQRRNVGSFRFLSPLKCCGFAAFFSGGMTAVKIEPRQIDIRPNEINAVPPDLFQAAVTAPFAKMVIHRLPADFFFIGSPGGGSNRKLLPLTAGVQGDTEYS